MLVSFTFTVAAAVVLGGWFCVYAFRLWRRYSDALARQTFEIDRGVLDRMTPAFEHLLRNSVVHGIESPGERAKAGKDATGTITLAASHQGGSALIEQPFPSMATSRETTLKSFSTLLEYREKIYLLPMPFFATQRTKKETTPLPQKRK